MPIIIGENNTIHSTVIIGEYPQHLKYVPNNDEKHDIFIGSSNTIREYVCIHCPMEKITSIGSNNYIMTHCTINHDCIIEDNCIISSSCCLGGYSTVLTGANIGMNSCLHPYVVCGSFCMVGMGSSIVKHIPPFCLHNPKYGIRKINTIGMSRSGKFTEEDIKNVMDLYNFIDNDWKNLDEKYKKICNKTIEPYITNFLKHTTSNRKIENVIRFKL